MVANSEDESDAVRIDFSYADVHLIRYALIRKAFSLGEGIIKILFIIRSPRLIRNATRKATNDG